MRDLKFRAWNFSTKEFMSIENGLGTHFDFSDEYGLQCKEGVVLMQFTGLKDKNGKEIYEGDIVPYKDSKGVVSFHKGSFVLTFNYLELEGDLVSGSFWEGKELITMFQDELEVIGNIYKNPEVLK